MTTYYVSPSGSDANNGLGPDASHASNKPYLTIGKLIAASGVMVTGDIAYIAPGTYRETITMAITSPTTETKIYGDPGNAQGFKTAGGVLLGPGYVVWSAYTTNDKTAPAAACPLASAGRDFMTFQDILFVGGDLSPTCVNAATSPPSVNWTMTRCVFISGRAGNVISITGSGATAMNWVLDSCIIYSQDGSTNTAISLPTVTGSDYDANILIKNCLFFAGHNVTAVSVATTGALAQKPGGVTFRNCTIMGGAAGVSTGANVATTIPVNVYNCLICSNVAVSAGTSGNLIEDYNYLIGSAAPRTNVTAGTHSQAAGTSAVHPYALLVEVGQSSLWGFQPRPFLSPMLASPLLGFDNQASSPTVDIFGTPRPAGPGITWGTALPGIGYTERGNTGTREITTVRTGSNALKLLGPATQDFDLPVNATSTTVTVYGRYDGTYAGTLPQMIVRNGEEAGVATATATMAGAADTWEQLSLNFTPTTAGIVTIRLQSNSTAGGGAAFFDDFAVA